MTAGMPRAQRAAHAMAGKPHYRLHVRTDLSTSPLWCAVADYTLIGMRRTFWSREPTAALRLAADYHAAGRMLPHAFDPKTGR